MSDANGSALAVVEPANSLEANVGVLMRRATDVAGVCREIVLKTAQAIQGRKYVRVEGWQSIAVAYGCVASARDVEVVQGGVRAIGEVRRMSDGAVVSTAEGFVGTDECIWYGGTDAKGKKHEPRPMYAIRAMAQTRAISRACRSAFAFVVTLIDGNLATTPFEEVDGLINTGTTEPPPPVVRGNAAVRNALRPSPPQSVVNMESALKASIANDDAHRRQIANEPPAHTDADFRPDTAPSRPAHIPTSPPTFDRNFVMPFANKKNEPLHALSEKSLKWFQTALTENIANPDKAQFADKARHQLGLITAEMNYRGL